MSSLYSDLSDTEEEGEVVKYVMDPIPDGNGLRNTFTAVGNDRGEVALERPIDVRRSATASCCFSHCTFDCQAQNYGDFYGGEEILSKFQTDVLCSHSSQWLERTWLSQEQYDEEIWPLSTLDKNFVELMDSANVNLSTVDAATLGIILNYPGKCFSGDFVPYRYYPINLSCLGLVL